jgi:hypothetical protein
MVLVVLAVARGGELGGEEQGRRADFPGKEESEKSLGPAVTGLLECSNCSKYK